MTLGGWIFMTVSCGSVVGLCAYCFYAVLSRPSAPEQLHAPQTIDTKDQET
jgi:hypothetical protein